MGRSLFISGIECDHPRTIAPPPAASAMLPSLVSHPAPCDNPCMQGPPRKRMNRREHDGYRYLTFSTYRPLPLLANPRSQDLLVQHIALARRSASFRLIARVIMPKHLHLILVPTQKFPVPRVLSAFKQPFAECVIARCRSLGAPVLTSLTDARGLTHFWQHGGGFDRNVRDEPELLREIEYIHRNPVKRGLVQSPGDWGWSSARWYTGVRDGELEVDLPWGWRMEEHVRSEAMCQERDTTPGAEHAGHRREHNTPSPRRLARADDGGAMARETARYRCGTGGLVACHPPATGIRL